MFSREFLDVWLSLLCFVLGSAMTYYSITSEKVQVFLVRHRIKRIPMPFVDLAKEYRQAELIPDDLNGTRVARQNYLAQGLARFAQGARLSRKVLAAGDEGYIAALMKCVALEPRRSDVTLVAEAARKVLPLHTDYLSLNAITTLADNGFIEMFQRDRIKEAISLIERRLGTGHVEVVLHTRERLIRAR